MQDYARCIQDCETDVRHIWDYVTHSIFFCSFNQ